MFFKLRQIELFFGGGQREWSFLFYCVESIRQLGGSIDELLRLNIGLGWLDLRSFGFQAHCTAGLGFPPAAWSAG